jgi:hypothetical protein
VGATAAAATVAVGTTVASGALECLLGSRGAGGLAALLSAVPLRCLLLLPPPAAAAAAAPALLLASAGEILASLKLRIV